MREQIKRINIYLLSLFIFLIIFNIFSFANIYSQNNNSSGTEIETAIRDKVEEKQQNIADYIFDNSVTTMLLSTFIIAIIGTLITKLRNLKKKLDMIEILTKSQIKMKQQALEKQKEVSELINRLSDKIDTKYENLEQKIDNVEKESINLLLRFMSENSIDRKR